MPISKIHVVRFFQLLKGRRFAEAERVLERVRKNTNETEWNSGYLHALDGIILAQKSNDSYAYIKNIKFDNQKELKKSRKEFLKEYKNKIHSDYDRGFFAAWADYMLISIKDIANTEPTKKPATKTKEEDKEQQTKETKITSNTDS